MDFYRLFFAMTSNLLLDRSTFSLYTICMQCEYDSTSIILTIDRSWQGDWLPCNAAYDEGLQATITPQPL